MLETIAFTTISQYKDYHLDVLKQANHNGRKIFAMEREEEVNGRERWDCGEKYRSHVKENDEGTVMYLERSKQREGLHCFFQSLWCDTR